MKKFISFLLLCVFTFQICGFFIEFKALQFRVKKEIKQTIKKGVPESELVSFNLTQIGTHPEFKWEKEHKEFWYKGSLYDIVSQHTNIVKCIDDHQETTLFKNLEIKIKEYFSKSEKGRKALQTLGSFLNLVFILQENSFIFQFFHSFLDMVWFTGLENSLLNVSLEIATPPPNFC